MNFTILTYLGGSMVSVNKLRNISFSRGYARFARKATQLGLDLCGGKNRLLNINSEGKNKAIDWIGKNLSSAENRLILGASALMSQPFIDAANKDVDSETRRISVCRTVAKIIAGTATGYSIRKLCIKTIDAFTRDPAKLKEGAKFNKLRTCLLPALKYTADELSQYKNALGTLLALGVMVFTNFLIDAPLTKFLTNVFAGKGDKNV